MDLDLILFASFIGAILFVGALGVMLMHVPRKG